MREPSGSPSKWYIFPLDDQERKTKVLAYRVGRVAISSARLYPQTIALVLPHDLGYTLVTRSSTYAR